MQSAHNFRENKASERRAGPSSKCPMLLLAMTNRKQFESLTWSQHPAVSAVSSGGTRHQMRVLSRNPAKPDLKDQILELLNIHALLSNMQQKHWTDSSGLSQFPMWRGSKTLKRYLYSLLKIPCLYEGVLHGGCSWTSFISLTQERFIKTGRDLRMYKNIELFRSVAKLPFTASSFWKGYFLNF